LSYLVDTNVFSELRKGDRCHPSVRAWFDGVAGVQLHTSVVVIGEIRRGIERARSRDPAFAAALERWLADIVMLLDERIHPVSRAIAEEWGRLAAPRKLPIIDTLLAATAIVHGLTVVTRNLKDIADTGVSYLNPFDPIH
jgi:predicted nucleic acid-binding protein